MWLGHYCFQRIVQGGYDLRAHGRCKFRSRIPCLQCACARGLRAGKGEEGEGEEWRAKLNYMTKHISSTATTIATNSSSNLLPLPTNTNTKRETSAAATRATHAILHSNKYMFTQGERDGKGKKGKDREMQEKDTYLGHSQRVEKFEGNSKYLAAAAQRFDEVAILPFQEAAWPLWRALQLMDPFPFFRSVGRGAASRQ